MMWLTRKKLNILPIQRVINQTIFYTTDLYGVVIICVTQQYIGNMDPPLFVQGQTNLIEHIYIYKSAGVNHVSKAQME